MAYKRDVDFIPGEPESEQTSNLYPTIIFYLIMISLFIFSAGIVLPNMFMKEQKEKKATLVKIETEYAGKAAEYDKLLLNNTKLSEKLKALKVLGVDEIKASLLIAEFEACKPQNVRVTDLSLNQAEISIDAFAPTNAEIAKLLQNLYASKYFSGVTLSNISSNDTNNERSFSLTIKVAGGTLGTATPGKEVGK